MSTTVIDTYSDHDMQCPAEWENGFKEGIVLQFGTGTRSLSDPWTGDHRGSTFDLVLSDHRRRFRQQLVSADDRYWVHPLTVRMTTRANRANLGTPYTAFVGPIIDIAFPAPLQIGLTLGDLISHTILSDEFPVPWRLIRDGFLAELTTIAESLDLDAPEPIIYGQHRRIPDVDPASPQGFEWTPIYLGVEGSPGQHVWMVAGHACADLPDVLVVDADGVHTSVLADGDWEIPHTSAPAYEDRTSSGFGNTRRYTLIRAAVGNADADACAAGEKTLTVFVDGVEPVGDGTGAVITDRLQQYKHFVINFVANRGPESYQSGAWLTSPTWDVFGTLVPIIEETSFDDCAAIAEIRLPLPGGSPAPDYAAGYIGAAIIGSSSSDRSSVARWIAEWNRSCGVRSGWTHFGQFRVVMLHPSQAIKDAAPLYTDAYEMLDGSFRPMIGWSSKVNRTPYRADYEHRTGQWKTSGTFSWDLAITEYGAEILGETREYRFAPGVTAADHLARMEVLQRKDGERRLAFAGTVGPDAAGQSLGYLEIGDYFRYVCYDAIADANEIRLAWVEDHQVQAGDRTVSIVAVDVEELIDFDQPPA